MANYILVIGIFSTLFMFSLQISTKKDSSYVGAVVEYHPITEGDDGQVISGANVNNYRTIIKTAASYAVDIIVFPEFGLTSADEKNFSNTTAFRNFYRYTASVIPSPNLNVDLCNSNFSYTESLKRISCFAREFKMYVVVNHLERVDCNKNCSNDGFLLYNTNVVFDRQGRLISRYRKYNLLETGIDATVEPEISTFTTDFGVTFGQLIGYDILKENPAMYFTNDSYAVKDIVLSSRLFNERPFLGTVQLHAGWAHAADVNLLASSYNDDYKGSGGSGIYAGKIGPIRVYHPGVPSNALIVAEISKKYKFIDNSNVHVFKQADVPTIPNNVAPLKKQNRTYDDLSAYTSTILDPKKTSLSTNLCNQELCCEFSIEYNFNQNLANKEGTVYYRYRLVVFNGVRQYMNDSRSIGVEICAIVACSGNEIDKCSQSYSDAADAASTINVVEPTTFNYISIRRWANLETKSFYSHSTLTNDLLPINTTDFGFVINGPKNHSMIMTYLTSSRSDIITFGILGRRFDKDGLSPIKPSSGTSSTIVAPSMICLLGFCVLTTSLELIIKQFL